MISVTFYNFSKQVNSTARPSTNGVTVSCLLKESTSTFNPTFVLDVNTNDVWNYTYTVWGSYYYYVVDKRRITNDIYEVDCEIDVLATWKDDIMGTNAFVLFSTSDFDIGISDYRLSSDPITITKSSSTPVFPDLEEAYVVTYIGTDSCPSVGISEAKLKTLQGKMMSDRFVETCRDWYKNLINTGETDGLITSNLVSSLIGNTSNTVTSCIYMPKFYGHHAQGIILAGEFSTGLIGTIPYHALSETYTLNIPWAFPNGDFRNRAEFTALAIYLPGYGFIALNADNYQGQSSITVQATLDSFTGEVTYLVDGKAKGTCTIGYPVQVGTSQKGNVMGAISGVAQAIVSGTAGNPIGAIAGGYNAVRSAIGVDPSSVGSMGGSSSFECYKNILVLVMTHNTNVDPSTVGSTIGRPLNAVRNIGSLSGYVETTNFSVNCNAPNNLKEQINSLMNGGVYIE